MKKIKRYPSLKLSFIGLLLGVLAGCGGGDDGDIFGNNYESATHCVSQNSVASGVEITNTCSSTIIILTERNERLVIPAGSTHTATNVSFFTGYGACFSPNEPKLDSSNFSFSCI
ncbi:MAG: hypothetical protein GKR95_01145 [Gammaproteobacteria bacterium]|nr:hypothetical protein [Gammaproteobacteria bacterium]